MPFLSTTRGNFGPQGRSQRRKTNYFGTGADGDAVISSNTSLSVLNAPSVYSGDMVVRNYTSLTINEGFTLTTSQPCRGLLIYVDGNCTINGTLSMTARGPDANPTVAGASDNNAVSSSGIQIPFRTSTGTSTITSSSNLMNGCGNAARSAIANHPSLNGNGTIVTLVRQGANGGSGGPSGNRYVPGSSGVNGSVGQTGGGGGGTGGYGDPSGNGGAGGSGSYGSCFGGGSGGAGGNYNGVAGGSATIWGGRGGDAQRVSNSYTTTGGSGNPGGQGGGGWPSPSGTIGSDGGNGTGGLIILIVSGNLTIGPNGKIEARGVVAPAGYEPTGGRGGGSGGGNIVVAHAGTLSNSGSVLASGTDPYTGNNTPPTIGGGGGNGSVQILNILY